MNLYPHSFQTQRAMSLATVMISLVVLLLLVVAALGVFTYKTRSQKATLEAQMRQVEAAQIQGDLDKKKAEEQARLTLARNRQYEVLAQVRAATNAVGRLLTDTTRLTAEAAALRTGEAGRKVALHDPLVVQARRLYETELKEVPAREEIIPRLEGVRRIELQVLGSAGTAYEPEADLAVTAQNATLWAEQALRKVGQVQTLLSALTQEAQIKVTTNTLTAASPTLDGAIAQLNQTEEKWRQQLILTNTQPARLVAMQTEAIAESNRIVIAATLLADKIKQQADQLLAQAKRSNELQDASETLKDTAAKIKAQEIEEEARKLKLKQKASTSEVQVKLGPFITPGYWFPKTGICSQKKPHSFSQLQSMGALTDSIDGKQQLVDIAIETADKVRPRWAKGRGSRLWRTKPAEMERIEDARQLLVELGPMLVEMGLLQP